MAKTAWKYEPSQRWIRVKSDGEWIANTKTPMLMIENLREIDYYFPPESIKWDRFEESEETETSGYRGTKRFWNLKTEKGLIEKAAWTYEDHQNRPEFDGWIAINWDAADHWFEEEEEQFLHARSPYHRVDTVPSSRKVEVLVEGVKVAESSRPYLLFETSLPTRYYLPAEDVDHQYLNKNEATKTVCPYKGEASYFDVTVNGQTYENLVWYYPDPIPEAPKIKNLLAFWPEKNKRVQLFVDGEEVKKHR